MDENALQLIFKTVVLAKVTYATSAWWGGGSPRRLTDTVLRHLSAELFGLDYTQWMARTFSSLLLTVTMCFLGSTP